MARKKPRKGGRSPQAGKTSSLRLGGIEKALQRQVSQLRGEALGFIDSGRTSLEKNIRGQLQTMVKKTTQMRRRLEGQITKGIKAAEARIGRTAERMLKELKLPTQTQINVLRSEIRSVRHRVDQLSEAVEQLESSHIRGKAASSM